MSHLEDPLHAFLGMVDRMLTSPVKLRPQPGNLKRAARSPRPSGQDFKTRYTVKSGITLSVFKRAARFATACCCALAGSFNVQAFLARRISSACSRAKTVEVSEEFMKSR